MKLKDGFLMQEIAGETVVVPTGEDQPDDMLINLNKTGALLWKMLESGAELPQLAEALVDTYGIDPERASANASAFVDKLKENGFLA